MLVLTIMSGTKAQAANNTGENECSLTDIALEQGLRKPELYS